jgi:DNA-binding NtrC family response regulator
MLNILETIGRVAPTDASILIMGEIGTGKELIAEAIHQNSLRRNKPFTKVNLGGISTSLFESEMFGHIRGAFTDARFDRTGRFEMSNKGTIFLDEIGDLDAGSQVKLLRVLQDRTYEVLGSSRTKTVDVRVVCATNKNLNDMVSKGTFRAMKWLQQLPLPGNIRQLKNLVERSILVSKKDELTVDDFRSQLELSPAKKGNMQLPGVGTLTLEEVEVEMIKRAMDHHKNKISRAAASLGLTRSALYRRLDKYQIPYDETED